jgi:putative ABC transport system ATP-binding protein
MSAWTPAWHIACDTWLQVRWVTGHSDSTMTASITPDETGIDGSAASAPDVSVDRDVVFTARGITKVYQMGEVEVQALRGVDFDVSAREFVVLLGPSGSGKSTLLNILGGLDIPTSGEVIYKDHNLTSAGEAALTEYRRTHVGFVFQFYNLIPSLTARENVALVTEIVERPMTPEDALAMVGMEHRLDHFPAQLSGGEQQRVAIARAIAKRPDVLLCDEPTGALDITTGVVVLEAIERVNRELGTAAVVITHNAAIAGIADRVVRLFDGRITGIQYNESKVHARDLQW